MLTKLFKLAYDLDRKGLYSEAEEIEEMMKAMAKRVGLKVDDLVSLANEFDKLGAFELADQFDNMVKIANKWAVYVSWETNEHQLGGTELHSLYDTKDEANSIADELRGKGENAEVEQLGQESGELIN